MEAKSWVIVDTETGKAECETWIALYAETVNKRNNKYKAVPIAEWLSSISRSK